MKYSVIDISSSSLSLIVANADGKKTEIVFKDRVSLYLFPHLEGKSLSPRGIDKLTDALSLMKEKCASLGVEACYVISTAQSNPLDQTLRFSLAFDMDGIKDLFRR